MFECEVAGELVAVKDVSPDEYMALQDEFVAIQLLPAHPNIVPYLGHIPCPRPTQDVEACCLASVMGAMTNSTTPPRRAYPRRGRTRAQGNMSHWPASQDEDMIGCKSLCQIADHRRLPPRVNAVT